MSTQPASNLNKNLLFAFLLAIAFLFLKELAATAVQESDGAEIAFQAINAGVLHPPGFPLYSLISIALAKLFPTNPYQTLAIFSVFCQCAAAFVVYLISHNQTRSFLFSIGIALSWLLFPATLRSATDTEVFALNNLLFSLTCLFSIKAIQNQNSGIFRLAVFFFALAISNHHMAVLALPFVLAAFYKNISAKNFFSGIVVTLLGLSPYLYLLYRINNPAEYNFFPLNSFNDFINYFLRAGYGTFSLTQAESQQISYLPQILKMIWQHNPLAFLGLLLPILFVKKPQNLAAFLCLVLNLWFGYKLIFPPETDIQGELLMRFYPQIYLSLLFGLIIIKEVFNYKIVPVFLLLGILLPALSNLNYSLRLSDAAKDRTIDYEIRQILKELPDNSIFISPLDRLSMGIPLYQKVYSLNPEVKVLIPGMLGSPEYLKNLQNQGLPSSRNLNENIKTLLDKNYRVFSYLSTTLPDGYSWVPKGITWEAKAINSQSLEESISAILGYCADYPLADYQANPYRRNSNAIIENVFLLPIKYALNSPDFQLTTAQKQALTLIIAGHTEAGSLICQQGFDN